MEGLTDCGKPPPKVPYPSQSDLPQSLSPSYALQLCSFLWNTAAKTLCHLFVKFCVWSWYFVSNSKFQTQRMSTMPNYLIKQNKKVSRLIPYIGPNFGFRAGQLRRKPVWKQQHQIFGSISTQLKPFCWVGLLTMKC